MKFIAVIGSIGVGKTTLLKYIKDQNPDKKIHVIFECVDDFSSFKNHNPLQQAYDNPRENCVAAQIHIAKCLSRQLERELKTLPKDTDIVLTDRSIYSTIPFINAISRTGILSSFTHDFLLEECKEIAETTIAKLGVIYSGIIFLDASIQTSIDRIKERNRQMETEINKTYLKSLREEMFVFFQWWKSRIGEKKTLVLKTNDLPSLFHETMKFIDKI